MSLQTTSSMNAWDSDVPIGYHCNCKHDTERTMFSMELNCFIAQVLLNYDLCMLKVTQHIFTTYMAYIIESEQVYSPWNKLYTRAE